MTLIYCRDQQGDRCAALTLDQALRIHDRLEPMPAIPADCQDNNFNQIIEMAKHFYGLPVVDETLPTNFPYSCYLEEWEAVLKHVFSRQPIERAGILFISARSEIKPGNDCDVFGADVECFGRGKTLFEGEMTPSLYLKPLNPSSNIARRGASYRMKDLVLYDKLP